MKKGRKKGNYGKNKESCFWQNIIKHINLEVSGTDSSDVIFDEMLMLAEEYDIKNYYRIVNMKNELIEYDDNIEYSEEDLKNVNEILDKLLLNKIAARWPAKAVAQFYFI